MRITCLFLALMTALWSAATTVRADAPVTVFAAASLRGALDDVAQKFDGDVVISYGGSGSLARQAALGAPADVIILAHPRWMDWLEQRSVVSNRADILGNALVVIGPDGAPPMSEPLGDQLQNRLGPDRLAMGHARAVPAGLYAAEWLNSVGLWSDLRTRLAETENVRLAMTLVARGETPLGVVYKSDANADPTVSVVYSVPENSHAPIRYPAAALTPAGLPFLTYVQSPTARALFADAGFALLSEDGVKE